MENELLTSYATAPVMSGPDQRSRWLGRWTDRHPVVLFTFLGLIVAAMYLIKLTTSPDFVVDELYYSKLGQNILDSDSISLATNPFLVHPPLYFLIEAGWYRITGQSDSSIVGAAMNARVLSAIFCAASAVLTGMTARELVRSNRPGTRTLVAVVATLLVAVNGFMLSFGRTDLVEPSAVAAGCLIVLVAHRMRNHPAIPQILVLGVLIGLGTLIKQTVLFAALTPLVTAVLLRSRRRFGIAAASIGTGAVVWFAFPVWAALNGHWAGFWSQQSVSLRRLLGLVHTTGVSLPNGSPLTQFLRTFALYSSGYAAFAVGAVAVVVIALGGGLLARSRGGLSDADALPVSYGILTYGFMVYSFGFGAGNQQLVIYAAPSSALLCTLLLLDQRPRPVWRRRSVPRQPESPDPGDSGTATVDSQPLTTPRRVVAGAVLGVLLLVGGLVWGQFYVRQPDNGTSNISRYVAANIPACTEINSTGSGLRWQAALPANPVRVFADGPRALTQDVHLFLLSPKDARYQYGNMSAALAQWITSNGRLLYQTPSRSSESLQLWQVGTIRPLPIIGKCVPGYPGPSTSSPASGFLEVLGGFLVVVSALGVGSARYARRRRTAAIGAEPHQED